MIHIDMDMPKNCQECRFLFDTLYDSKTHYYCHAMELPLCEEDVTGRPEDCPLQEVDDKQEIIIPKGYKPWRLGVDNNE